MNEQSDFWLSLDERDECGNVVELCLFKHPFLGKVLVDDEFAVSSQMTSTFKNSHNGLIYGHKGFVRCFFARTAIVQ